MRPIERRELPLDLVSYQRQCASHKVFSRGALQLTFRFLRKKKPAIALEIQNCLANNPLKKPDEIADTPANDHFEVRLSPESLRDLLFGLSELVEDREHNPELTELGNMITLKTLISDWLDYAKPYLR